MIVLSAIGKFFKKIWDWIKQTAWIQPLLIVGIIFGIIFSIPSIVNAIKDAQQKAASSDVYYRQFSLTLEGEEDSKADKFTKGINDFFENGDAEKPDLGADKFFLVFVKEDCPECTSAKGGFEVLEEEMGSKEFKADDGKPFKLFTIFSDEETTGDDDSDETSFERYLNRNDQFFANAQGAAEQTAYFEKGHLSQSDLDYMGNVDKENFLTPTILLIDLTVEFHTDCITEVMFGVSGGTDYEKAETLLDCWNHKGDFSIND